MVQDESDCNDILNAQITGYELENRQLRAL